MSTHFGNRFFRNTRTFSSPEVLNPSVPSTTTCPSSLVPSQLVSSPRGIAPSTEQPCLVSGSSAKKYTGADSEEIKVGGLNVSVGNTIGRGAFAEVKAAYCHSRNHLMALKVVNRKAAPATYLSMQLPREIELLRMLSHPHVITAHKIVDTKDRVFILMDLASNGDLLVYLKSRRILPEDEARYLFMQITEGMQYLHSISIAHRDLKLENILLDHNMSIKIADFGFAIDVSRDAPKAACGSHSYAAPEVFNRARNTEYDAIRADLWSLGIILYALLSGRLMFGGRDSSLRTTQIHFSRNLHFTDPLKDLVCNLLKKNPIFRLTCTEISQHDWLTEGKAVEPAALQSLKSTKDNLGIQFYNHVLLISSSTNSLSNIELLSIPSLTDVAAANLHQPRRHVCFLCNLISRISSAVRYRRNSSE